MEVLQAIQDFLQWAISIPAAIPADVWAILGSSLGVSVIVQTIKSKFQLSNPKFILTITTVFSLLAAALGFFIFAAQSNPQLIGQYTTVVLGITTILYRFVVQPITLFLRDVKEYQVAKKQIVEPEIVKTINETNVLEDLKEDAESKPTVSKADF